MQAVSNGTFTWGNIDSDVVVAHVNTLIGWVWNSFIATMTTNKSLSQLLGFIMPQLIIPILNTLYFFILSSFILYSYNFSTTSRQKHNLKFIFLLLRSHNRILQVLNMSPWHTTNSCIFRKTSSGHLNFRVILDLLIFSKNNSITY